MDIRGIKYKPHFIFYKSRFFKYNSGTTPNVKNICFMEIDYYNFFNLIIVWHLAEVSKFKTYKSNITYVCDKSNNIFFILGCKKCLLRKNNLDWKKNVLEKKLNKILKMLIQIWKSFFPFFNPELFSWINIRV